MKSTLLTGLVLTGLAAAVSMVAVTAIIATPVSAKGCRDEYRTENGVRQPPTAAQLASDASGVYLGEVPGGR